VGLFAIAVLDRQGITAQDDRDRMKRIDVPVGGLAGVRELAA
jgi:hypothetical protein